MSLYDDATLICLAKGAAGKDGVVYNIKPEEKLKPTELITDGSFDDASEWTVDSGVSVTGGKAVFDGTSGTVDIYQDVSDLSGKTVKVSFTISDYVAGDLSGFFYSSSGAATDTASSNGNFSFIKTIGAGHNDNVGVRGTNSFEGKVDNFSVKEVEQAPLDFTFTRGSNLTATRVGPDGLIEKGRENLVVHSNKLDEIDGTNIWYLDTGSNPTSTVTAGGISGYDGSSNTWEITKTTEFGRLVQDVSYNGVATISCYAKAGDTNWFRPIVVLTGSSDNRYCFFDLTGDGAVGGASTEVIDKKIEKIGNGWFRCSFTVNESIIDVRLHPATGNSNLGTTGSVYVQNVQLEAGLVATPYIDSKSTTGEVGILEDEPRFDYTGGGCPTWLGEPGRVNLLQYSEYVDGWNQNTADVALSPDASPEGVKNAYRVSGNGTGTQAGISVSITSGEDHTGSIWIKKVSGASTAKILDTNNTSTTINITTEWQRFEVTAESTSTTGRMYVQLNSTSSDNEIDIYGAQLEEGSYSTSYIPNHGSSGGATRAVEQADVSSLQSNGIITDAQGTFFIDLPDYSTTAVQWDLMNSNLYFSVRAAFFVNTMTVYQRVLNTQSTVRNISSSDVPSLGTTKRRKLALSWNGTSLITSINGTSFDDTIDSSIAPELDKIRRANWTSTKVSTDQILMFDKQLTKEELNELTSIS